MVQLVLSPAHGWEDLEQANENPQYLLDRGFYPLLALVAVTAMLNGLYKPEPYSYATQLQIAITQVAALFASMMLARLAFETLLPSMSICPPDENKSATVCIYCISLMTLITIISNLCPTTLTLLWFLPAFVIAVAWQARKYLEVSQYRLGRYIILSIALFICMPMVLGWLLGLLIIH